MGNQPDLVVAMAVDTAEGGFTIANERGVSGNAYGCEGGIHCVLASISDARDCRSHLHLDDEIGSAASDLVHGGLH